MIIIAVMTEEEIVQGRLINGGVHIGLCKAHCSSKKGWLGREARVWLGAFTSISWAGHWDHRNVSRTSSTILKKRLHFGDE